METCLEAAGQAEWLTRENSDILVTQYSTFPGSLLIFAPILLLSGYLEEKGDTICRWGL